MKKILFAFLIFSGLVANAQPGYTNIAARYNWLAGEFRALNIPVGGSPTLQTGQDPKAGGLWLDSTTDKIHFYDGGWHELGSVTQTALDDTAAAIRAAIGATGWDDMLAVGQSMTTSRTIDGGGSNNLSFSNFLANNWTTISTGNQGTMTFNPIYFSMLNTLAGKSKGITTDSSGTSAGYYYSALVGQDNRVAVSQHWIKFTADTVINKVFVPTAGTSDSAYTRDPTTGQLLYQAINGGGGGGNTIYTGDDALTGDRIVDLATHILLFGAGGFSTYAQINPDIDNGAVDLRATGTADLSSSGFKLFEASGVSANGNLDVYFNDEATIASIHAFADISSSSISYTADTHDFSGNVGIGVSPSVLFEVQSGDNNWLYIDPAGFGSSMLATDGTAISQLSLNADPSDPQVHFDLNSSDGGGNTVILEGRGNEGKIYYTANVGHVFTGNVDFTIDSVFQILQTGNDSADVFDVYQYGILANVTDGGGGFSTFSLGGGTGPAGSFGYSFNISSFDGTYTQSIHSIPQNIILSTNDPSGIVEIIGHTTNFYDETSALNFSVLSNKAVVFVAISATDASAITPSQGMVVCVNTTNGTFTSVGFWGYDGTSWNKF